MHSLLIHLSESRCPRCKSNYSRISLLNANLLFICQRIGVLRKWYACALPLFLALLVSAPVTAQTIRPTDGFTPSGMGPGTPVGSFPLSEIENMNYFNGRVSAYVPLVEVGGRGAGRSIVGFTANEGSLGVEADFQPIPNNPGNYQMFYGPYTYGWEHIPNYGKSRLEERGLCGGWDEDEDGIRYCKTFNVGLVFIGLQGSELEFRPQAFLGQNQTALHRGQGFNFEKVFYSREDQRVTYVSDFDLWMDTTLQSQTMSGWIYFPDGTRYKISQGVLAFIIDRNGNTIEFHYDTTTFQRLTKVKDSIGREVNIAYNVDMGSPYGVGDRITYKGFGGALRTIRITTNQGTPVFTNLFPEIVQSASTHFDGRTKTIWLPDDRKYVFRYNLYGNVNRIELPTGGAIEYDYAAGVINGPSSGLIGPWALRNSTFMPLFLPAIYHRVIARRVYPDKNSTVFESRQEISRPESIDPSLKGQWNEGYQNLEYVNIATYDFNGTLKTFETRRFPTNPPSGPTRQSPYWSHITRPSNPGWFDAQPTFIEGFDINTSTNAPGALLRKTEYRLDPFFPHINEIITTLADTNQVSKQTFLYDEYNNRTDVYEFDFGNGAAPTHPVRHTHIDYLTENPINGQRYDAPRPNDPNNMGVHIRSLPKEEKVFSVNTSNGAETLIANTVYEYDNYADDDRHEPLVPRSISTGHDPAYVATFTLRGNPTGVTVFKNAAAQSGPITTNIQYDVAGNVVAHVDGRGKISTLSYSDSFCNGSTCGGTFLPNSFAFVTGTTSPIPDTTGLSGSTTPLTTSNVRDFWTGRVTSTTDANNQTTTYEFNDPLDRLKAIIRPTGGGRTDYEYGDTIGNLFLKVLTDMDSTRRLESVDFFDGLGRTIETKTSEGGTNVIITKREYDALGRVFRTSNPYRSGDTVFWTTTAYDSLSRIKSVTTADGAVILKSHSGNQITVTDPAGKKKKSVTDGLGRLIDIHEDPDNLNLQTHYDFDALDNIVKVTQDNNLQQPQQAPRVFVYDSLKRLTSSLNPENGLVSYEYDDNGNVLVKTDARLISSTYEYDNLNRLKSRTYSDGTPTISYKYDNVANGRGRVTRVSSSLSACAYTQYDEMGRIRTSTQETAVQPGGPVTSYTLHYEYNLAGMLTSQTYPSGRVVKTDYDDAGRISGVKNGANGAYYAGADPSDLTNRIQYSAAGHLKVVKLGNGLWEHTEFNSRLQVKQIGLGTTSSDSSKLKIDYTYGVMVGAVLDTTKNNGNVQSQTITLPGVSAIVQNYEYDELNRLKRAQEDGSTGWTQQYSYDRFGNRTGITVTDPVQSLPTGGAPEIDPSNNRLKEINSQGAATGYDYDDAGNVTQEPESGSTLKTYSFDAENRVVQVKRKQGTVETEIAAYHYDGNGKRIKRIVGGQITIYVYDFKGALVAEYSSTAQTSSGVSYITLDMLGSTRARTGSDGQVKERHDYLPFGEEIPSGYNARSSVPGYGIDTIRQKFTLQERDDETGLYFMQMRYYASATGRFTSPDLIAGNSTNPQSLNLYVYVRNNPLRYIDPTGLSPQEPQRPHPNTPCSKDKPCDSDENDRVVINVDQQKDKVIVEPLTLDRIQGPFRGTLNLLGTTDGSSNPLDDIIMPGKAPYIRQMSLSGDRRTAVTVAYKGLQGGWLQNHATGEEFLSFGLEAGYPAASFSITNWDGAATPGLQASGMVSLGAIPGFAVSGNVFDFRRTFDYEFNISSPQVSVSLCVIVPLRKDPFKGHPNTWEGVMNRRFNPGPGGRR